MNNLKLFVGQRVFIEKSDLFHSSNVERSLTEVEVIKANNTSAYVTYLDMLDRDKPYSIKISQKDLCGKTTFERVRVWLTVESFEKSVLNQSRYSDLKKSILSKINSMSLSELENINDFLK